MRRIRIILISYFTMTKMMMQSIISLFVLLSVIGELQSLRLQGSTSSRRAAESLLPASCRICKTPSISFSYERRSMGSLLTRYGRKIEDEEKLMKEASAKSKRKAKKANNDSAPAPEGIDKEITASQLLEAGGLDFESTVSPVMNDNVMNNNQQRVQGAEPEIMVDPFSQPYLPPEILFFGEPRSPPPVAMVNQPNLHRNLLYWARHATVLPRNVDDRLSRVLPQAKANPDAEKYRLNSQGLTYEKIFKAFVAVQSDLEATKSFLDANTDVFSAELFAQALTGAKLTAQFNNDMKLMNELKAIRDSFILAYDQLFFPLNIEIQKAETRVMTYLARAEMRNYARDWDAVEMTLVFTTLLTSRLTWNNRARDILQEIDLTVSRSAPYLQDNIRRNLIDEEFRSPGTTAELYRNGSMIIQYEMPELYARVHPEVKLLQESFELIEAADIKSYAETVICPRDRLSMEELKYRLKVYIRALEGIQGEAYDILLARATQVYESIWGADLLAKEDQWYKDFSRDSINFETYEPDRVPPLIAMEQRLGGTGNAFIDFTMNVMQGDTVYGPAFNGKRKKAAEMEDWLKRDINWNPPTATNEEGKIQFFREAFMRLTEARKEHEAKTGRVVMKNLLDEHERVYADNSMFDNSKVEDISEFLEEEQ